MNNSICDNLLYIKQTCYIQKVRHLHLAQVDFIFMIYNDIEYVNIIIFNTKPLQYVPNSLHLRIIV